MTWRNGAQQALPLKERWSLSRRSDRIHAYLLVVTAFVVDFLMRAGVQSRQYTGIAFGASAAELGLIGAPAALAYILVSIGSGRFSDRFGRKPAAAAACAVLVGAYLVLMYVTRVWHLMALALVAHVGAAIWWPTVQAWLGELGGRTPAQLNRLVGVFNFCWSAGMMLGPVVVGWVWVYGEAMGLSQQLSFLVSVVCAAGVLGIVLVVRERPDGTPQEAGGVGAPDAPNPRATTLLYMAWTANFASYFAIGIVANLFQKLGDELGYDEEQVGLICAAVHFGQVLMFALILTSCRWQFRLWPLYCAPLVGIGGALCAVAAQTPALFGLAFGLTGLCSGVTYYAGLFYALQSGSGKKGKQTGLHEGVLMTGALLGPVLGGAAASLGAGALGAERSLRLPYLLAAVTFVGAIGLQRFIWHRAQREQEAHPTLR